MRRNYRPAVTLLFSAQTEADVYCRGMMAWWAARHRRFKFIPTLTREQKPGVKHGRIPAILPDMFPDLSAHSVFIAGTPSFVEDCTTAVTALGAARQRIHTEAYFAQSIPEAIPADRLAART